jgi:hypothetical protein
MREQVGCLKGGFDIATTDSTTRAVGLEKSLTKLRLTEAGGDLSLDPIPNPLQIVRVKSLPRGTHLVACLQRFLKPEQVVQKSQLLIELEKYAGVSAGALLQFSFAKPGIREGLA